MSPTPSSPPTSQARTGAVAHASTDTVDVRCPECGKLLVKVVRPALTSLDLRCARCRHTWRTVVRST